MKKSSIISVTSLLVLGLLVLSPIIQANGNGVSLGSRKAEVKTVQAELNDVTDSRSENAYKICINSETGLADPEKCQYWSYYYPIRVISPNGGEVWDRNQVQTIKWDVVYPPAVEKQGQQDVMPPYPYWHQVSIDLFRQENDVRYCSLQSNGCVEKPSAPTFVFVKHIATVDLSSMSYNWTIPSDVPDDTNYVVRISRFEPWALMDSDLKGYEEQKEIWPMPPYPYWNWGDQSDGTFTITGGPVPPTPTPTPTPTISPAPTPTPTPIPDFSQVISLLGKLSREIAKLIELLKGLK